MSSEDKPGSSENPTTKPRSYFKDQLGKNLDYFDDSEALFLHIRGLSGATSVVDTARFLREGFPTDPLHEGANALRFLSTGSGLPTGEAFAKLSKDCYDQLEKFADKSGHTLDDYVICLTVMTCQQAKQHFIAIINR